MSYETLDCAGFGCDAPLAPFPFDECAPQYAYHEIRAIYVANIGQPFEDITDAEEWADRVDPVSTAANAIRKIPVIGTVDQENGEQINIPNGTAYGKKTFTLNGSVFENSAGTYDFVRSLGCNKKYLVWYETMDGQHVYGGNAGIEMTLTGLEPITDARTEFRTLNIQGTWQDNLLPLRNAAVI